MARRRGGGPGPRALQALPHRGGEYLPARLTRATADLSGAAATALGTAWVALGAFLHFHPFRGGLRSEGSALGALGKIGALPVFAGALGFVLVHLVSWTN